MRLERDPVALGRRPSTTRPAASNAAPTSASRSTKMPDATRIPPGSQLVVRAPAASGTSTPGDEVREHDVERRLARSAGCPSRARIRRASRFRRALAAVASMAIGIGVDAERASRPRDLTAAIARIPDAAADVEDAGARQSPAVGDRLDAGEAQPGRRMQAGPEGHARVEGEDDVVGLAAVTPPGRPDDEPPADPHDREVRLPGLGPVGLVDDPRPELADRPQAERLEVTERLGGLGDGPLRGRPVARRHVGPDDRRPGRVDARAETLVDELERRLDARAAGRDPAEDLADRLDRLDVGLDRELEPARPRRRRPMRPPRSAKRSRELLAEPAAGAATASPASSAYSVEQLALALRELGRDDDVDEDVEVALRARPPEVRHALAAQPDLGARLGAGLDLDLLVAVDGRHRDRRPERRLGDRHVGLVVELGPLALERRMRRDVDRDVQASRPGRRAARPRPRSRAGSGGPRRCRPGS